MERVDIEISYVVDNIIVMLKGKCPKCGARYYGWCLRFPRQQTCDCGTALELTANGRTSKRCPPLTAEEYSMNKPVTVPAHIDKTKEP